MGAAENTGHCVRLLIGLAHLIALVVLVPPRWWRMQSRELRIVARTHLVSFVTLDIIARLLILAPTRVAVAAVPSDNARPPP